MNSPPIEWTLGIGYLAILDYLRSHGEPDGDTASECVRSVVMTTQGGKTMFSLAWLAFAVWFWRHILKGT